MDLTSALTDFCATFRRSPENTGVVTVRPDAVPINEPFPLGESLHSYFSILALEDRPQVAGRINLFLFDLDMLETAQHGWRWIRDKSGKLLENTAHWHHTWIVFAERNGDAVSIDTLTGQVFGNIQARRLLLAGSLAQFFAALTEMMKLEIDKYDYEIFDDDFNLLPEFYTDAHAAATAVLGTEQASEFMHFFFG